MLKPKVCALLRPKFWGLNPWILEIVYSCFPVVILLLCEKSSDTGECHRFRKSQELTRLWNSCSRGRSWFCLYRRSKLDSFMKLCIWFVLLLPMHIKPNMTTILHFISLQVVDFFKLICLASIMDDNAHRFFVSITKSHWTICRCKICTILALSTSFWLPSWHQGAMLACQSTG